MDLYNSGQVNRKKIALNLAIFIFALVSYINRDYEFSQVSFFERLVIDTLTPLQEGVVSAQQGVGSIFEHYLNNVYASKENISLRGELANLEMKVFELDELKRENLRLKELLGFSEEFSQERVMAQIVGWDASSDFRVLRINRGSRHGVQLQSTVMTAKGLVGYVYRLTSNYADVLTILDSNNRVDGLIQRTRSHGIVEGYSGARMTMKYVTRTEPIILGDTIVTSGLGNVYPKGLKVGSVSRIERQSYGITQRIEVKPAVDFGRLEEVIVLTSHLSEELRAEWRALDERN